MIRKLLSTAFLLMLTNFVAVYAQTGLEFIVNAESLKSAGNLAGAIAEYDKAIKLEPTNAEYMFRKGKTYMMMKDQDNAIMCFEKTVQLKKGYVDGHKALAVLYKRKNKLPEAIKQYDEAFQGETDNQKKAEYKISIIKLLAKMKKFNEAGNHINDAKQVAPDNLDVLYFDARFGNTTGKYEAAKNSALKATTSPALKMDDPKVYAKYFFELGLAYYKMEKYDDANTAFTKANFGPYKRFIIEMSPQYFQTLANSYFKVFEMDESKNLLETALKMKKDFSAAHELLTKIALSKTDKSAVIKAKQMGIESERDPVKRAALFGELAEMLFEAGKFPDAAIAADEVVKINPNNYNSMFVKALALSRQNKNNEAIEVLNNTLKYPGLDQETKAQLNFALGLVYGKAGNSKLADTSFKKAVYGSFKYAAMSELKKLGDPVGDEGDVTDVGGDTGGDED
jgi:tetratricopeptide (TPR) repeat protein